MLDGWEEPQGSNFSLKKHFKVDTAKAIPIGNSVALNVYIKKRKATNYELSIHYKSFKSFSHTKKEHKLKNHKINT